MAAILKNGCHFFPAEYPEGRPHRKCAEMSSEQAHTHEPFTTAHVSRTLFAPWVLQAICADWAILGQYYKNSA